MPLTVVSKTAEYDAASPDEVAALVAEFEAATAAHEQAKADNPAPQGAYRYDDPVKVAHQEALAPTAERLRSANAALAACRSLPLGTAVRFSTTAGWSGTDYDEGVITGVTSASYVVSKTGGSTARLDRENAHEYQSSYSGTKGARSLSIVRTPAQQRDHQARTAAKAAQAAAERDAYRAQVRAVEAQQQALRAQHAVLHEARSKALALLLAKHGAEYDALVVSALDLLALDAPGRTETAPVE